MKREELEKEADEKAKKRTKGFKCQDNCEKSYVMGALDFAEPREKRIEELEVTNKKISDECHKLVDTLEKKQKENELLETQNIKLQAEVYRLTIKNADIIGKIAFTENALNNTKVQIEKMKCCANCRHSRTEYEHCKTNKHEKWEIKND